MPVFPFLVELWLIVSTCLVAGGWILSALGKLNRGGYAGLLVGTALICWLACRRRLRTRRSGSVVRRFRRPLPLLFLVLAGCALVGGLIYAPSNWDGLTYRLPRVLNWLSAEKWHWIRTITCRVNVRAAGFEWLTTPLIVFTKSDRLLFAINFVSFLLLPGLLFSVFTRIGVRSRAAWHWMWILPGGYSFALQAGSIANDAFGAVYALAAVDFALRGQASKRFRDFALSLLALGLLTAGKATNLALGLPWLVVAFPLLIWWARRKPALSGAVAAAAAMASLLPVMVLNHLKGVDWLGISLEIQNVPNVVARSPVVGLLGNSYLWLVHNFVPPFFPFAGWYRTHASEFFPEWVLSALKANLHYPDFFLLWELPGEDVCGIGFGPTILLFLALVAIVLRRKGFSVGRSSVLGHWRQIAFCVTLFVAVACVMARSGFSCDRILTPFYPFVFGAALLLIGHGKVVRQRWWRGATILIMLLAVLVVVVTPPRPLFPAQSLVRALKKRWPQSGLLARAERVYAVYGRRGDALAEIRNTLPAAIKVIGLVASGNDMETSLWRPFSKRRVVHVLPGDGREWLQQLQIEYVVIGGRALELVHKMTIRDWCERNGAQLVQRFELPMAVSLQDENWFIARILPQQSLAPNALHSQSGAGPDAVKAGGEIGRGIGERQDIAVSKDGR